MDYKKYLSDIDYLSEYSKDKAVTIDTIIETLNYIKERGSEGGAANVMICMGDDCRYIHGIGFGTDVYGHTTVMIFDRDEPINTSID